MLPLWPSEFVTLRVTSPAVWGGVVAAIVVLLFTTTLLAAVPPSRTVAPDTNPVPVMVIDVPPAVGPEVGLTLVTVGAGSGAAV